jgi:hypothetical protein
MPEPQNNLNEIFQLCLIKYQDDIARKERLENKGLGYLTTLSITIAVSIAILIHTVEHLSKYGEGVLFFMVICFIAQFYFTICSFFFSLQAYKKRTTAFPDPKSYFDKWDDNKDEFLGSLNQDFKIAFGEHQKMITDLLEWVDLCRYHVYISLVSFIIFMIIFLYTLIGGL